MISPQPANTERLLKVGFHDLRRSRCSQWLMQGVYVRTVQKLTGALGCQHDYAVCGVR